ncbi:class I SAM-dependent methyltransferase [Acidithiobacillus sp. CV18-2]|nr:class I SAM-dependent methyltransferase [Acidithiobacillus sp. CV18-3]MBU2756301.1 class I SAM-dependent methyltransferase [Acidithiobacillus sp. BN09-2]MBU2775922.1 class I SAM-dependent methyltransferase [Acidithiobacillus sp. CV18-2]MBU2799124.1 class I SAM-dependent methyltransferase [Acidithiobacillus sp. VAN18-4]
MRVLHFKLETAPPKELEHVTHCPICKSQKRSLLYDDLTDRVFFCAPGTWTLYACEECGSAYLDPRPSRASIGLAYQSYYTHEEGNNPEIERVSFLARLKRGLRNGYLNHRYSVVLRPSLPLGRWLVPLLPQRRMIDEYVRHLPRATPGAKLLDIGCGNGGFLRIAQQLGWKVWGTDVDENALQVASQTGAKVFKGMLPNLDLPDNSFDVITLSHVIEHVHDPDLALREIHRLLKPGGLLWLATPNLASDGARFFKRHWRGLEVPRHLCLFTPSSITALMKSEGFSVPTFKRSTSALPMFNQSYRISAGLEPYVSEGEKIPRAIIFRLVIANIKYSFIHTRSEFIILIGIAEK